MIVISLEGQPPCANLLTPELLGGIAAEGARAGLVELKKSLRAMGQATQSRYFYQEAADSCEIAHGINGAERTTTSIIASKKGLRLQHRGGTVYPVKAKSLLIPFKAGRAGATKDSPILRKSIGEMGYSDKEIIVIKSKSGNAILMHKRELTRKNKAGENQVLTPLGVLLKSATIKAKPQLMPDAATLSSSIAKAGRVYLNTHLNKTT
ncbi:MAG: hypothetical protein R3Y56_02300 [Akkermansia sp.]